MGTTHWVGRRGGCPDPVLVPGGSEERTGGRWMDQSSDSWVHCASVGSDGPSIKKADLHQSTWRNETFGLVAERGPGHPIQSRGAPLHDTCHPRSECEKTCAEAIPKPTHRRSSGGRRKASAGMVFSPPVPPRFGRMGGGESVAATEDTLLWISQRTHHTRRGFPNPIAHSPRQHTSRSSHPVRPCPSSPACAEDVPLPVSPPSLRPLRRSSISLVFFIDSVWIDRPGRIPSWLPIGRSGFPRRWAWNLDHLSIHHTSCSVPRVLRQQPTRVLRPPPSIHRTKTMAATSFVQQAVAKALGVNQVAKVSQRECTKRHTDPREREMAENSKDGNRTKTSTRRRGLTYASS